MIRDLPWRFNVVEWNVIMALRGKMYKCFNFLIEIINNVYNVKL